MNIIPFPRSTPPLSHGWHNDEFQQIMAACSGSVAAGEASGWEVGTTDTGDPQVYLIGPAPDFDCILCISRIGRHYIIEDGEGRVLLEQDGSMLFAETALAALRSRKAMLIGKVAIAWTAFRDAFEEKATEITETMEVLVHTVAPQLAALA